MPSVKEYFVDLLSVFLERTSLGELLRMPTCEVRVWGTMISFRPKVPAVMQLHRDKMTNSQKTIVRVPESVNISAPAYHAQEYSKDRGQQ